MEMRDAESKNICFGHLSLAFCSYRIWYLLVLRNKHNINEEKKHGSKLSFKPCIFFLYDFIPLRFRNKYNSNREKMHGSKFSSVCIWAQDLIRRPASPSINIIDGDAGRRIKINLFGHLTLAFFPIRFDTSRF